ncbi:HlyD family secretion protein [Pelotalea chapellei]|uniref:HlyD family secretion protein n=1 Tax=Pelotalea chapellei TaxID=44671 RepID=A0ABS5UBQ3_9BACT|nr:HlyD family secretion protein [Pelotalea chapellei]MBT1073078.1 HlyD family secretion protein [Pelotalea chapellei]
MSEETGEKNETVQEPSEQEAVNGNSGTNGPGGFTRRHKAMLLLLVLILICTWFGASWWIKGQTHIETDNAFIEANVVALSAKVPGTVKRVLVRDNQFVKQGELLVEIDEQDYRVQVSQATAGVEVARNETSGEHLKAEASRAAVQLALARHEQAGLDLQRGEALLKREVIPREQLDRLKTAYRISASQLKEAEEELKRHLAEAGLSSPGGNKAKVLQKQAQLEEARLRLSYTRITAPVDGYITRKSVEQGANIQAGQPLMALVPLQQAWVVANYKEGQLSHIRPGQKVELKVDAYPHRSFTGRVDSIMAGTGAAFSLLPPENATGNYVKVVQRIPVKIAIDSNSDPEHLLRVGMSVVPTVLVDRTTRDVLRDANPFR